MKIIILVVILLLTGCTKSDGHTKVTIDLDKYNTKHENVKMHEASIHAFIVQDELLEGFLPNYENAYQSIIIS